MGVLKPKKHDILECVDFTIKMVFLIEFRPLDDLSIIFVSILYFVPHIKKKILSQMDLKKYYSYVYFKLK